MESALDPISLFDAIPGNNLLIKVEPPRFTILSATKEYTLVAGKPKEAIIERDVFDAFPSNPDDPTDIKMTSQDVGLFDRILHEQIA
jgi:hypothetical protein